jgi:hypothetical protein
MTYWHAIKKDVLHLVQHAMAFAVKNVEWRIVYAVYAVYDVYVVRVLPEVVEDFLQIERLKYNEVDNCTRHPVLPNSHIPWRRNMSESFEFVLRDLVFESCYNKFVYVRVQLRMLDSP